MIDFTTFYQDIRHTSLFPFEERFRQAIAARFKPENHGDWPAWVAAYDALPELIAEHYCLNCAAVRIGEPTACSDQQRMQLRQALMALHPWRKGPYQLFGLDLDTEWRSDWKWQRLLPHISDLRDKVVLDVGCGSGYHCWRMLGEGAKFVLGIDPSLKFLVQFQMLKHYLPDLPVHLLPLRCEDLPPKLQAFDSVFSMGVLYHRKSPFDHLEELREALVPGGQLILETLIIPGPGREVLVPADRYAKMPNVWFLPSSQSLCEWIQRAGFNNIKLVDITPTSTDEQRSTEWMRFHSLKDFLKPGEPELTSEGYPAPTRAIVVANKPQD